MLAATQLGQPAANAHRQLQVGAIPSALATLVPAAVAQLTRRARDLEVRLREGRLVELANDVRSGDLHAAVCFHDAAAALPQHDGTRRHELFEEPIAIQTSDPLEISAVVRAELAITMTPQLLAAQLSGVRIVAVSGRRSVAPSTACSRQRRARSRVPAPDRHGGDRTTPLTNTRTARRVPTRVKTVVELTPDDAEMDPAGSSLLRARSGGDRVDRVGECRKSFGRAVTDSFRRAARSLRVYDINRRHRR